MNNSPLDKLLKKNHDAFANASDDDLTKLLDVIVDESYTHGGNVLMDSIQNNLVHYLRGRFNNHMRCTECQNEIKKRWPVV